MKKTFFLLSSIFILSACSNNDEKEIINETTTSEVTTTETTTEEKDEIVSLIEKEFPNDVDLTINKDTVSSDIEQTHTEYVISARKPNLRKKLIETQNKIDTDNATDKDRKIILDIQNKVKNIAKKLPNDYDAVQYQYADQDGNNYLIAYSTKKKDLIPLLLLGMDEANNGNKKDTNKVNQASNNISETYEDTPENFFPGQGEPGPPEDYVDQNVPGATYIEGPDGFTIPIKPDSAYGPGYFDEPVNPTPVEPVPESQY